MSSEVKVTPLRIAIVGGGIAGLSLAVPLAKAQQDGAQIDVQLYEAATKFGEIGAGIAFGPNAQRTMTRLGIRDVLDSLIDVPPENVDKWFDVTRSDPGMTMDENLIFTLIHKDAGIGGCHRADFLDNIVAKYPPGKVSFRKRLVSYSDKAGVPIKLNFQDGTTTEADVLIGCDGVKSRVRCCLFAENSEIPASEKEGKATRQKYSGWIAYRGIVPSGRIKKALGLPDDKIVQQGLWPGSDRHLLYFPIRMGALVNIVAFVRDREGARAVGRDGPWTEDVTQKQMLEDFKSFNTVCLEILKAIDKPTLWGIFDIPELPTFVRERVALVGDAAHAMTPHQGAGAGQCVEDAFILSNLLIQASSTNDPSKTIIALQAYDHVRRPRATKVQRTSAHAGTLYEFHLPGVMDDIDKLRENMSQRMKWIWEWDEEVALKEALNFVEHAGGSNGV